MASSQKLLCFTALISSDFLLDLAVLLHCVFHFLSLLFPFTLIILSSLHCKEEEWLWQSVQEYASVGAGDLWLHRLLRLT